VDPNSWWETNAILVLAKLDTQVMTIRHKDKTGTRHSINISIGVQNSVSCKRTRA
jgi:hypothetical protein